MSRTPPHNANTRPAEDGGKLGREIIGLLSIFLGLLVVLSLATFDGRDPWLNHVVSATVQVRNKAGLFGAYLAGLFYDIIGAGAWTVPGFLCLAGVRRILGSSPWPWWRWTGFALLGLSLCLAGAAVDLGHVDLLSRGTLPAGSGNISSHGGGIIGHVIYTGLVGWMGPVGAFLIWFFSLALALQMLTGISLPEVLLALGASGKNALRRRHAQAKVQPGLMPPLTPEVYPPDPPDKALPHEHEMLPELEREIPAAQTNSTASYQDGKNDLVHPLVPRPKVPSSELLPPDLFVDPDDDKQKAPDTGSVPDALPATDAFSFADDAEMPPWVKDFEMDRLGVPTPADTPRPEPQELAPPRREPANLSLPESAPDTPDTQDDADLYEAVWGPEQIEKNSSLTATIPDAAPAPVAVEMPEQEQPEGPLLSAQTAAALDALRAAAHNPPDPDLRPGPDALTLDAPPATTGEPRPLVEENTQQPELPGTVAGPDWAAEAFEEDIPIFESPPVEQVQAPGLVQRLTNSLVKPRVIPLPSLDLLQSVASRGNGMPREVLEEKGSSLMNCLKDFGVLGELVGITPGPVVTMFEVRPAPGVRVSRISNLSDDLALALKAVAVRIQAPVPGTDTVGIEIPNELRETVCLKELLGSTAFAQSKSLLTLALGKDIAGVPAVADLAVMPHLLVAGATGAGKSVGINSIILSLLYKARPDEVQLLLIDPKRVEMAIYADLPHLVHPVVTEMQLAKNALEWAVAEMERRYDCIARAQVRNIADYNAKITAFGDNLPEGMADLEFMPYLVLIIDELADLMLVAAKEVENSIVRLAQLARAAGIHLILATQRPSVDVVTGLIKANFPCRISFQVTSKHDS
ncbi:DNA translocase FtsK, partial [Desulfovibrio sp. OttesenSCG-928-M16]|nr:DNA translocase FtsK [Desulfovibrio sp. OttesenSCG-928-M16]